MLTFVRERVAYLFQERGFDVRNVRAALHGADFDVLEARENIRRISPQAEIIGLSARTGEGLDAWYRFLLERSPQRHEAMAAGIENGDGI